jgi:hypothetical protein
MGIWKELVDLYAPDETSGYGSVTNNNGFGMDLLTSSFTISHSKSIIALSPIYPFHKLLEHAKSP